VLESLLELNYTIDESEERIITPRPNVIAGVIGASALTNEDISCSNNLTTELLNTKALSLTVSSVSGTSYRFLMCHDITLNLQTQIT
jgi:hypothetical protein